MYNILNQDITNKFALNFSQSYTLGKVGIVSLHNYIMFFLVFIFFFTIYFLYSACSGSLFFRKDLLRFRFYIKNKEYNLISHSRLLEFIWILIPSLILLVIAIPSLTLLYFLDSPAEPLYNISVIGNQWYWSYEYNDFNLKEIAIKIFKKSSIKNFIDTKDFYIALTNLPEHIIFDSNLIITSKLEQPRLLTTDQVLVIPVNTPIRFLITSNDVIHSWALPNYGVKVDAVPGRMNQVVLETFSMGSVWGQCSELCGVNHGFMPIEIRVLDLNDFLYFIELKLSENLIDFFKNLNWKIVN